MNFVDQISKFSDPGLALTQLQIITCLLVSFVLCVVVAKVYQRTYKGPSYSPAFMITLIMCGMVISAVMLIIGSNIARAFSLVGALSIIRFRNAVKDPRDVAFIFLAMAIGMACGTGFYLIGITLTVITSVCILLLSKIRFGERGVVERILKVQAPLEPDVEKLFDPVLKEYSETASLLSMARTKMGTELELTYVVRLKASSSLDKFLEAVSKLNKNLRVEIVGSSATLDL